MLKYSIIIPVCNNEELTRACLDSIKKNTRDYEIIIIDNGSKTPWQGEESIVRNNDNLGFPCAINQGIAKARGEIIVLLNNDTIVSAGWLDRLGDHLKTYDLVGPVTNKISGYQQLNMAPFDPLTDLDKIADDIYKKNTGRSIPFHRLVFFCVAIKREVFDKIGLLDERFSPGNFEDDDFCLRAIEAGFHLGIATDSFIYHAGSSTHKSLSIDHALLLRKNQLKFQEKWPSEKFAEVLKKQASLADKLSLPPKRTISLVMIAKNEAKGLERAIASARPFVDKVIVAVDRSSCDKTAEIAEKCADEVKYYDWRDDFAWARNFAHEGVDTDWLMFLDGHEFIESCPNFDYMLNSPADGLLCRVELESGSQIVNPRIYRNGLQFTGAVHELQNCKTLTVYQEFLVKHDRLGSQSEVGAFLRNQQRDDQLNRIMGEQLKKDPLNRRAAFHLALHEQSIGNFKEALKYQKQYLKSGTFSGERWYIYFNRALCHYSLGHTLRALWSLNDAEKEVAGRWEVAKLRGLIYYRERNFKRAIKYFVDSFEPNTGDVTFKPWKRKDDEVWNLIGQSYFELGQLNFARLAFERASEICKDDKKKKLYFDRANLMSKMSVPA